MNIESLIFSVWATKEAQDLGLEREEIEQAIKKGYYFFYGVEMKNKSRQHWLCFVERDGHPFVFVLVYDPRTNEVITLLNPDRDRECMVPQGAIDELLKRCAQ